MTPDLDHGAVDALYAAAEAATPGPYSVVTEGHAYLAEVRVTDPDDHRRVLNSASIEDATFFAASDPTTVRALIDRLRAVEAALEQTVYMLDWTGDMAMHLPAGYDETRLAALELLFPGSADKAAALRERVEARAALRSRP